MEEEEEESLAQRGKDEIEKSGPGEKGDDGCDFTSGEIKIETERCLSSSAEAI